MSDVLRSREAFNDRAYLRSRSSVSQPDDERRRGVCDSYEVLHSGKQLTGTSVERGRLQLQICHVHARELVVGLLERPDIGLTEANDYRLSLSILRECDRWQKCS